MEPKINILVVDDDLNNIQVGINILKENKTYHLIFATSGEQALARVKERSFDLILLDILMQPMDGFEVCKKLQADPATREIPIIFLTAKTDTTSMIQGFELGGVDYVTKPFNSHELNARVRTHLQLRCFHMQQMESVQKEVILMLGDACEFRSAETGRHNQRIGQFSALLAELCGLSAAECECLRWAAPLHDIGKISIPDAILQKPGKLTPEEFAIIKTHSKAGFDILSRSDKQLMGAAAIIAHEHHEYWNGAGYPQGLQGEHIHIYGRIVAIVDVFDALLHRRVYKNAWHFEETTEYLAKNRGTQFDPDLLNLFLENIERFKSIHNTLRDDIDSSPQDVH
ncbi:response regulator [Desulfobulbus rhabdoformis]|uniref:HD domain-containing phosphohydrolase n=1 Tax=Desulfobulbus rhabdoformis TaxID=34032 RepID=UPI001965869B|nr:response regulator [Desulfobulbus rhabdoformis]